jgi:hypothetical protein
MKKKKVRKTITISDDVDMELRIYSAKSRRGCSALIEEALRLFLKDDKKK